jgi:ribosomal protein S18 acetylase RimI-like enzyme
MSRVIVAEALPAEREAVLNVLLRAIPPDERTGRVAQLLEQMACGTIAPLTLLVARTLDGAILGSAIAQPLPGAGAVVWPPQLVGADDQATVEDALLNAIVDGLRRGGTKLAQAFLAFDAPAAALERHGFRRVTEVWYLRRDLRTPPQSGDARNTAEADPNSDRLEWYVPPSPFRKGGGGLSRRFNLISYENCNPGAFQQTLMHTYTGSLDAPELNGVRTADETIASLQAGAPDLERWWLAESDGRPVGVLLLADGLDAQAWEISYVGVVPEARGKGIGQAILERAIDFATSAGRTALTLIVDARNRPALALYNALGFRKYETRQVYLRIGL